MEAKPLERAPGRDIIKPRNRLDAAHAKSVEQIARNIAQSRWRYSSRNRYIDRRSELIIIDYNGAYSGFSIEGDETDKRRRDLNTQHSVDYFFCPRVILNNIHPISFPAS
jgi:hypothetical protein